MGPEWYALPFKHAPPVVRVEVIDKLSVVVAVEPIAVVAAARTRADKAARSKRNIRISQARLARPRASKMNLRMLRSQPLLLL